MPATLTDKKGHKNLLGSDILSQNLLIVSPYDQPTHNDWSEWNGIWVGHYTAFRDDFIHLNGHEKEMDRLSLGIKYYSSQSTAENILISRPFFLFLKKKLFIYMAVLGLCCGMQAL